MSSTDEECVVVQQPEPGALDGTALKEGASERPRPCIRFRVVGLLNVSFFQRLNQRQRWRAVLAASDGE